MSTGWGIYRATGEGEDKYNTEKGASGARRAQISTQGGAQDTNGSRQGAGFAGCHRYLTQTHTSVLRNMVPTTSSSPS